MIRWISGLLYSIGWLVLPDTLYAQLTEELSNPNKSGAITESVRRSYRTLCADCHGADGRGAEYRDSGISIPDFTSKNWMKSKTPTQLKLAILLGKGEEMPPFEDEVSETEAIQLVTLLRKFAGLSETKNPQKTEANGALKKELERFRVNWSELSSLWEHEFNSLTAIAAKRERKTELDNPSR